MRPGSPLLVCMLPIGDRYAARVVVVGLYVNDMRPLRGPVRVAVTLLPIGDRYAARVAVVVMLLPIGDRYAARVAVVVTLLPIGDRYAAVCPMVLEGELQTQNSAQVPSRVALSIVGRNAWSQTLIPAFRSSPLCWSSS